jgi:beta-glucuronidase
MIIRDKNHPSVIAFSIFNEPETTYKEAHDYFKPLFDFARELDPQKRPLTGALLVNSTPGKDTCAELCDIVALNRYYGWYISGGGTAIEEAELKFRDEMDRWSKKNLNVPFVFTEFGTDTLDSMHKLPSIMWPQEYQEEYYERNFNVFDSYDFITGELTWNFADFQTTEGFCLPAEKALGKQVILIIYIYSLSEPDGPFPGRFFSLHPGTNHAYTL